MKNFLRIPSINRRSTFKRQHDLVVSMLLGCLPLGWKDSKAGSMPKTTSPSPKYHAPQQPGIYRTLSKWAHCNEQGNASTPGIHSTFPPCLDRHEEKTMSLEAGVLGRDKNLRFTSPPHHILRSASIPFFCLMHN